MLRVVRLQLEVVPILPTAAVSRRVDTVHGRMGVMRVMGVVNDLTAGPQAVRNHHARRSIEPVLQIVPHRPEAGQAHPTSLHRARTRHAVALAFLFHFCLNVRPSSLIIMQIHLLPQGLAPLACIHELPGELEAKPYVVGAATPLPVSRARRAGALASRRARHVRVVARARLHAALGAGARHRVRDRGTGDGVDEGCFAAAPIHNLSK